MVLFLTKTYRTCSKILRHSSAQVALVDSIPLEHLEHIYGHQFHMPKHSELIHFSTMAHIQTPYLDKPVLVFRRKSANADESISIIALWQASNVVSALIMHNAEISMLIRSWWQIIHYYILVNDKFWKRTIIYR